MNVPGFARRSSRRRSSKLSGNPEKHPAPALSDPARLEDILITHKLKSRRRRKPSSYYENIALKALARVMATSPEQLVDTLLRTALELCSAGTAGLSLLETTPQGEQLFRWTNLMGTLGDCIGGSTPRNFSPCGVTLDENAPQLFAYPVRRFQYLAKVDVPIVEALVIPVYIGDERPGTIWIVSHDDEVQFDLEDVRIMTGLAEFTSHALRLTHAYESESRARQEGERQIAKHKRSEKALRQEQSNLEEIIDVRTAQLQRLSARLMAMQDDERRHIARELHDSAGQYLAGIQMNLGALLHESETLAASQRILISDSLTMANRCTSEIRTISYLLHPPLLDEVGLQSAISWYVEGFAERSGIQVELDISAFNARLPGDIETALFRVVQQSLANIHRHSGSRVAQIRIQLDADCVKAEICDNGRGIPAETLKGFHSGAQLVGVGIAGMRERIRDMRGRFDIRSGENGTTVEVSLPLPAIAKSATA